MGKGGAEGQPFSTESRDWLRSQILENTIYCQLLKREGLYGRMVGFVIELYAAPEIGTKSDSPSLLTTEIPAMVIACNPWDRLIGRDSSTGLGIRLRITEWRVPTP